MQYVSCDVFLSGDRNHAVHKAHVSVAEVVVLRALHGDEAVVNIAPVGGTERIGTKNELARLTRAYRTRAADIREQIFPGANPNVPTTLKDIGVERDNEDSGAKPRKSKAAGKKDADADAALDADASLID